MKRILVLSVVLLIPSFVLAEEPPLWAPVDPSGCWSGYWISCTTGHKGPLSVQICKISDCCYQANFRGKFALVIPFRYTTTMQVTGQDGDKLFLTSSKRMPVLGTFNMSAVVTPTEFNAEYTSRSDSGRFVMTRN